MGQLPQNIYAQSCIQQTVRVRPGRTSSRLFSMASAFSSLQKKPLSPSVLLVLRTAAPSQDMAVLTFALQHRNA